MFKQLASGARRLASFNNDHSSTTPAADTLFPKVDPAIDGADCLRDCADCPTSYPRTFKIDEHDALYGHVKGWSTHVLVATGKTDWVRDVADERGSLMEAFEHGPRTSKPTNGKLMLSASNMPTPTHSSDYADPTTILVLPAFTLVEGLLPKDVGTVVDGYINHIPTNTTVLSTTTDTNGGDATTDTAAATTTTTVLPPDPTTLSLAPGITIRSSPHSVLILLCSQKTRDARCGQSAPLIRKELERHLRPLGLARDLDDTRPGGVGIYFISHVGGHKYSANVMVYRRPNAFGVDDVERGDGELRPKKYEELDAELRQQQQREGAAQCMWLARVKPEDCEGIVKYTVLQGKLVKPESQLRGGFDRSRGVMSW